MSVVSGGSEKPYSNKHCLIVITDPEGLVRYVSDGFCALSGFSVQELQETSINMLRHPDLPDGPVKDLWQTVRRHQPWMGMLEYRHRNRGNLWLDTYVIPIVEDGNLVELQWVYRVPSADIVKQAKRIYQIRAQGQVPAEMKRPHWSLPLQVTLASSLGISPFIAHVLIAPLSQWLLLSLSLSLVLVWLLCSYTCRRYRQLIRDTQKLVKHPVKQLIYTHSVDEAGQVELAMVLMQRRLQAVVAKIYDSSEWVRATAMKSVEVMRKTCRDIQAQQLHIDEVAAASEQMALAVQDVAARTAEAADLAGEAQQKVAKGSELIQSSSALIEQLETTTKQSESYVSELQQKSQEIGGIVDVIQGVAEQTNLLALNAAIEAARAGENGRGFAVVADEVRTLAQSTQMSTQKISDMVEALKSGIDQITRSMNEGRQLTLETVSRNSHTEQELNGIIETIDRISMMNEQIASSTEEQSQVSEEFNRKLRAIREASLTTVQGAELTLEHSSSSADLASRQKNMVSLFMED